MTVKDAIIAAGFGLVYYKIGKLKGKVECLDDLPNNEFTVKIGRYGKITVSKPKKDK